MYVQSNMPGEPKELTIYQSDHDLLIELRVIITEMRRDMKEMKDGVALTLTDHEQRLRALEKAGERWFGKQTAIAGFLGAVIALLAAYISTGTVHF